MTNDHCRFFSQSVQQTDQVADEMQQAVLIDAVRPVGLAVAAHIRRYHVESGRSQEPGLVKPGVPRFGESVAKKYGWTSPLLNHMHADAVCLDKPMDRFVRPR